MHFQARNLGSCAPGLRAPSLGKNLFQDSQNLCKSPDRRCKLYTTCMSVLSSWTWDKVGEASTLAGDHQRAALPPRRRSAGSGCRKLRAKFGFRPDAAVPCGCHERRIFSAARKPVLKPCGCAGLAEERGPTPGCANARSNTRPSARPAMPPPSPTESTSNSSVFDSLFRFFTGGYTTTRQRPVMEPRRSARAERARRTGAAGSRAYR